MCPACIASTAVMVAGSDQREEYWRCASASSENFSERVVSFYLRKHFRKNKEKRHGNK